MKIGLGSGYLGPDNRVLVIFASSESGFMFFVHFNELAVVPFVKERIYDYI